MGSNNNYSGSVAIGPNAGAQGSVAIGYNIRGTTNGPRGALGPQGQTGCDYTPSISVNTTPNEDGTITLSLMGKNGGIYDFDVSRGHIVKMVEDGTIAAAKQMLVS